MSVLQVYLAQRVRGDVDLVGHHDDGLPLPVQRLEEAHDLLAGGAVEIAGRLVGQQDAGRVDQRARDGHALPLSAGELVGPVLDPVAQPDPRERITRQRAALLGSQPGVDQGELHVVQRRGPGQQVEGLEHESDLLVPDPGQLVVVQLAHPVAVQPVLARRRAVEAADQVHEGGLARARRSHDGDELVLPNDHVDSSEGVHHLAADVVIALQVPGDDHGIPGNVPWEHGHPFRGIGERSGHRVRPIRASIWALARR